MSLKRRPATQKGYAAIVGLPSHRLRVMIVEDEMLVAMQAEDTLKELGHEATWTAPTVEAALSILERERPDLALLDVNLRGERVTPVAEALKALGVPFLLVTGYVVKHLAEPALRDAVKLSKPMAAAELREALDALALG